MIQVQSVTKNFGNIRCMDAISLRIPEGSFFGLIGSNGSGKSTLLRTISGVIAPDRGCVLLDGTNIWENTDAKARILYLSDEQFFLPHASIEDMRKMYRSIFPSFNDKKYAQLLSAFGLDSRRKINTFSKGMQKQASILLGLSVQPEYLLCDETFDGLDPVMRQLVKKLLAEEIAERRTTVVIASHNLREMEDICDHIALLHGGKLLFQRDLDDMKLTLQKIQAVFTDANALEKLSVLRALNIEVRGSMYTIVARGTREELNEKMCALNPKFCEFIPLTLEEIYISEMEDRGYDFSSFLA